MKSKEEILAAHIGESVESVIYEHQHYRNETLPSKALCAMQAFADQETAELKERYEGLDKGANKWRSERDNLLVENKSLRSEIASLRSRLDECRRKQMMG
jgi:FtsZ-binding cell division protein ZapB